MKNLASFSVLFIASCFFSVDAASNVTPSTITINGRQETVVPVVTVSQRPKCNLQGKTGSCCLTISVPAKDENVNACMRMELDSKNKPFVSLILQDTVIFKREVRAGETCYPIQRTPLNSCLNIYYLDISPRQNTADACFFLSISNLLYLDFRCIKHNNGRFEYNADHTAETEGVYEALAANGQQPMFTNN